MPYSFLLKMIPTATPPYLYRATVHTADGTHEAYLALHPAPVTVHLTDPRGNPTGGLSVSLANGTLERTGAESPETRPSLSTEDFRTLAAHLLTQYRKQRRPPEEIRRVFA
ncbi:MULTISPECIES: hypothetical protein [Streptomyces]|uniref:Uncharacterized protein n=1 Tax=Streptomyces koyangensis TaxID=188770 RepID=A0A385DKQ4_9ACTN|nr:MULTISPECIES: hypothetical protein [Streptomyces]AXQ58958.1 hypothetical protein D0C37_13910 [Streptomyces koyangensis]PKR41870.1 hypothetical protein CWE27_28610 [Streptomyces sp. EAG2]